MTEFNLSDKEMAYSDITDCPAYTRADVKEFIRLLKEKLFWTDCPSDKIIKEIIDKLAGSKLVEEKK